MSPYVALRLSGLVAAWILSSLVSGCDGGVGSSPVALELVGSDGTTRSLTLDELRRLEDAQVGQGGWITSIDTIVSPTPFEGAPIEGLMSLVGGLGVSQGVKLVASDGYAMTLTADQVRGELITTFDPSTGTPLTSSPALTPIVAWSNNGALISESSGGPLRLAIVSDEATQITDGHWWIKGVARLSVETLSADWSLRLEGARVEEMDRATFESGAAPGCHGAIYRDERGRDWTGIALWLLVGRVDDENVHSGRAFDRDLAAAGYTVEVVSTSGARVTLTSERLAENGDIILADRIGGVSLDDEHFPLRLVGENLTDDEMISGVEAVLVQLP